METDMRLLKLPLKLLALPLMLALYTLHIIGKLASNLSAYVSPSRQNGQEKARKNREEE